MKSAKLAVLALLAASLTAGSIPAYGYSEVPVPAPTAAALSDTDTQPTGDPTPTAPAGSTGDGAVPEAPATTPAEPTELPMPEPETTADAATVPVQPDDAAPEPVSDFDPVIGGGFPVPGPNTPMVTNADGSVRSAVETDISSVPDQGMGSRSLNSTSGGASMAGGLSRSANIQVTVVFATLTDDRRGVDQNAAKNSVSVANSYWRTMSNNRLGMTVVSTRPLTSTANSGMDYAEMMNTIKRNLGWKDSNGKALLVFVPADDLRSGGYGGILGGGWTSGPTSGSVLMPRPSAFTNNVVAHEFGHVLGLLHANGLQCTNGRADVGVNSNGRWSDGACYSREYADTLDLMGSAQYYHPVINSYLWDMGGFGKGNEIRNAGTAGTSKTYTLTPWGGSAANRAMKFTDPISKDVYYLELRQPAGYDEHLKWDGAGNRGVKIVKADAANSWALNSLIITPSTKPFAGYYNSNMAWQAGQTFTTATGTKVKINSVNASSASLSITAAPSAAIGSKTGSLYFNANPVTGSTFGTPTDQFLTCDWDGDGVATPATFYKGIWTLRNSLTVSSSTQRFSFGDPGDQPLCGDWDGDGKDTIGVYRSGVAYVSNTNAGGMADGIVAFGDRGDAAIVGDWNRDGYDTLGVARGEGPAKRFYLTNSNLRPTAEGTFLFGNAGDTAIAGDWDNDGYSTVGLHRANTWHLSNSNMRVLADRSFIFGDPNDRSMTGRWARGQATSVGVAR